MCGRFTLRATPETITAEFELGTLPLFKPRYNIAPTQPIFVVRRASPEPVDAVSRNSPPSPAASGFLSSLRTWAWTRWGLVPSWADDPKIGNRMINARGETAAEKPSFRAAFRRRRCLVPMDGYYEWRKTPTGKIPHLIQRPLSALLAAAGLWESWQAPDGSLLETCTILTTAANSQLTAIHDRMPVFLDEQGRAQWLDPAAPSPALQSLLRAAPDGWLEAIPVSTRVNSPAHDAPDCVQPMIV